MKRPARARGLSATRMILRKMYGVRTGGRVRKR